MLPQYSSRAYEAKQRDTAGRQVDRQMWGQTLRLAFQKGDPQFAPGYAGIHYRAGRIKLLEGCPEEARQHFEKAIKVADYSTYGELSRQALADL